MSPSARASGELSGIWRLRLASADCDPAVTRPSTQSAFAIRCRACATWSCVKSPGTRTIMGSWPSSEIDPHREDEGASRRRGGAIAERLGVIKPVGEIDDVELESQSVNLIRRHGVQFDGLGNLDNAAQGIGSSRRRGVRVEQMALIDNAAANRETL